MEKGKYIPLIAYAIDPLTIYVIDNEVIAFGDYGVNVQSALRSYQILHQLYGNPITREGIPKRFHKYFEDKLGSQYEFYRHIWLSGQEDMGNCVSCLQVDVIIAEEEIQKPVTLTEITLIHSVVAMNKADITHLNLQVRLSATEAFSLFANLCTTSVITQLTYFREELNEKVFKPEKIREAIVKEFQTSKRDDKKLRFLQQNFALDYLEYLLEELDQKKITQEEILWLSGMRPLIFMVDKPIIYQYFKKILKQVVENYQQLTYNQKIMYTALIWVSFESEALEQEEEEYFKANIKKLLKVVTELTKKFPKKTGKIQEYKSS